MGAETLDESSKQYRGNPPLLVYSTILLLSSGTFVGILFSEFLNVAYMAAWLSLLLRQGKIVSNRQVSLGLIFGIVTIGLALANSSTGSLGILMNATKIFLILLDRIRYGLVVRMSMKRF